MSESSQASSTSCCRRSRSATFAEFQAHDGSKRSDIKRSLDERLETREQSWLEMRDELRVDRFEESLTSQVTPIASRAAIRVISLDGEPKPS